MTWEGPAGGGADQRWWYLGLRTDSPAEIGGLLVHSLFPLPSSEEQKRLCDTVSQQFFQGRPVLIQHALPVETLEECVIGGPARPF